MWRARIGVLYPGNGLLDHEYWAFVPDGVGVFMTRTGRHPGDDSVGSAIALAETPDIERTAMRYTIALDSIAYACTTFSFIRGVGGDADIIDRIERATGVPATTSSTAAVKALRFLDANRVAVVTPYLDEINEKLRDFLEESGFEVVGIRGMQLDSDDIALVPSSEVAQFVRSSPLDGADAVFVSCTNFATAEILDALEQDVGLPVLSANQVTMWEALNLAGLRPIKPGVGSLYAPSKVPDHTGKGS